MTRLALILFIAGIYLICSGSYDLFIQAGTSRQPTTISVAELEKSVPANRHLVVTGWRPFGSIEGVRTTSMDLEDKARRRLVDTYGEAAVDKMVILAYHGGVGMGGGLGKLAGGVAIVGGMTAAFVFSRKSKQPTSAVPTAVPPTLAR